MVEKEAHSPGENITIGAIASFFGTRYGQSNIDSIFKTLGIKDLFGSKSEKISSVLMRYYKKDSYSFAMVIETLIRYHNLTQKDMDTLRELTLRLGFNIENKRLVPNVGKEIVLPENKPFDAFKVIEKILLSTKNKVWIIDPYVDHSIFTLYLGEIPSEAEIKILTKTFRNKFEEVAKKFKGQRSNFEVRLSDDIHDRHVIIDDRAWVFGQSIKDTGIKSLSIVECGDPKTIESNFLRLWQKSKVFL
jgi:hypothetical protein